MSDESSVEFDGEGIFHLNTNSMTLYTNYYYKVVVTKPGRHQQEFQQKIVVKEGDPPDFYIE